MVCRQFLVQCPAQTPAGCRTPPLRLGETISAQRGRHARGGGDSIIPQGSTELRGFAEGGPRDAEAGRISRSSSSAPSANRPAPTVSNELSPRAATKTPFHAGVRERRFERRSAAARRPAADDVGGRRAPLAVRVAASPVCPRSPLRSDWKEARLGASLSRLVCLARLRRLPPSLLGAIRRAGFRSRLISLPVIGPPLAERDRRGRPRGNDDPRTHAVLAFAGGAPSRGAPGGRRGLGRPPAAFPMLDPRPGPAPKSRSAGPRTPRARPAYALRAEICPGPPAAGAPSFSPLHGRTSGSALGPPRDGLLDCGWALRPRYPAYSRAVGLWPAWARGLSGCGDGARASRRPGSRRLPRRGPRPSPPAVARAGGALPRTRDP